MEICGRERARGKFFALCISEPPFNHVRHRTSFFSFYIHIYLEIVLTLFLLVFVLSWFSFSVSVSAIFWLPKCNCLLQPPSRFYSQYLRLLFGYIFHLVRWYGIFLMIRIHFLWSLSLTFVNGHLSRSIC